MKNLFVPYELALKLKEKGFDEPCFGFYNVHKKFIFTRKIKNSYTSGTEVRGRVYTQHITAPLYQQVIDWFREKQIKIVENPNFDWEVYMIITDLYQKVVVYVSIDKAIEEALKLI